MKGHPEIVPRLNEILVGELTAINQYFLGAKMCARQGYGLLEQRLHRESIEVRQLGDAAYLAQQIHKRD